MDTPYGPTSDRVRDRRDRRQAGGLPAPPRPQPPAARRTRSPTAPTCGRCSELGVRRMHRAVRVGQPAAGRAARRVRGLRPVRRPHQRPRRHVLRRPGDDARLGRRSVLPRAARDPARDRPRAGPGHPRRRHRRRDPGPALLDPRREPLVRRDGLGGHQHDRLPRGLPGPRARALLRQRLADHRLRRRPGGRARASSRSATRRVVEVFTENNERLRKLLFAAIPQDRRAARRRLRHARSRARGSSASRSSQAAARIPLGSAGAVGTISPVVFAIRKELDLT